MNAIETIQAKFDELTEVLKKQGEFVNQIGASIKQLRNERKRALAQVNETSGALQAYGSTLKMLKGPEVPVEASGATTSLPADETPADAPALEGEVVTE